MLAIFKLFYPNPLPRTQAIPAGETLKIA